MSKPDYVRDLRALVGQRPVNFIGSAGLILNAAGELLMQQRPSGQWSVPGGISELGEALEDTLRREILEETSLTFERAELLTVLGGPDTFHRTASGDEFYGYTAVYRVQDWQGVPVPDGEEGVALRFFAPEALPAQLGGVGRWAKRFLCQGQTPRLHQI